MVDPELRVHGLEALRVADASIMPTVVSGNTNAACIMIGEKWADLMLAAVKSAAERQAQDRGETVSPASTAGDTTSLSVREHLEHPFPLKLGHASRSAKCKSKETRCKTLGGVVGLVEALGNLNRHSSLI
jgi:hypothetical protein